VDPDKGIKSDKKKKDLGWGAGCCYLGAFYIFPWDESIVGNRGPGSIPRHELVLEEGTPRKENRK
jgi:hypothetical protein